MSELMKVLTRDGSLNWYHLETWAKSIENKSGYTSNLSWWLSDVSAAMKEAAEAEEKDARCTPDLHCTIEELSDIRILPFGWVLLKRHSRVNPDLIDIRFLGGLEPLERIRTLEAELEETDGYLNYERSLNVKLRTANTRLRRKLAHYARTLSDDSEWEDAQAEVIGLAYVVPELPPSDEGERLD